MSSWIKKLTGRSKKKKCGASSNHWAMERQYWSQRMQDWYREHYALNLDPIQNDPARVPSLALVTEIQGSGKAEPDTFLASGQRTVLAYLEELHDHGFNPKDFARILEFGVGLGRLLRHYYPFPAELHGCDVTDKVVGYSQESYGHRARILQTGFTPPLPYDIGYFDFIYANSVFTHIQHDLLPGWIAELARIAHPGACVIITVYGTNRYLGHVTEREFDQKIRAQGYLEWGTSHVTQNCLYATPAKLTEWWQTHFEVLEYRPHFKDQNHLILRKP
jgi:SAM-dependent methyltransferase